LDDTIDFSKAIVLNRNHEETARHYKTLRPVLKKALIAIQSGTQGTNSYAAPDVDESVSPTGETPKRKLKPRGPYANISKKRAGGKIETSDANSITLFANN
jgi:hypothetical protein